MGTSRHIALTNERLASTYKCSAPTVLEILGENTIAMVLELPRLVVPSALAFVSIARSLVDGEQSAK